MAKFSTGIVLLITAAVLGGLVCIMGLIYTYIYCTRMKPRPRWNVADQRISHYHNNAETGRLAATNSNDGAGPTQIKTHPFFIMHYVSKVRRDQQSQNIVGGGASPRH